MYLQKWFHDNYMVLNPGKCYYMTFSLNTTNNEFVLEDGTIVPSAEEHACGISNNNHFTFDLLFPFEELCKKIANN